MKKYIILAAAFIFLVSANTTFAAKPVIKSVVTNDQVAITVTCSECLKDTPGYVRITNKSGGKTNEVKFTSLNKTKPVTVTFTNLQLGKQYEVLVQSTGTEAAGNAYLYDLNGNGKANFSGSFTTPVNQSGGGGTGSGNSTPLQIDIVKEATKATISITCFEQCNGLKGDFTLTGPNYNKPPQKGVSLVKDKPAKLVFDGLTTNETYKLTGDLALPDGTPYKFPGATFVMDGKNQGAQTVNTEIQDINALNAQQYGGNVTSTTYTLLAPIDNLTKVETTSIGDYFNKIFNIIIGLCAALAVIMLVVNGIKYMTSESFTEKSELKKDMGGPILGLIIALGAYALLNTIDPALTGKQGLTVDSVDLTSIEGDTAAGSAGYQKYISAGKPGNGITGYDFKAAKFPSGIICPAKGMGQGDLATIAKSFSGKITYAQLENPPKGPRGTPTTTGHFFLDCSSYVTTVLKCAGINPPAYAFTSALFANAEPTSVDKIKVSGSDGYVNSIKLNPGDLVGWMPQDKGSRGSGHVMIYVGNGQVLDAHGGKGRNPGMSVTSPFSLEHYKKQINWVKRINK